MEELNQVNKRLLLLLVISNNLLDLFVINYPNCFSSVKHIKIIYDKYLSVFNEYITLINSNYSNNAIKKIITTKQVKTHLMLIITRYHSGKDDQAMLKIIENNEPLVIYYCSYSDELNKEILDIRNKTIQNFILKNKSKVSINIYKDITISNYHMAKRKQDSLCFKLRPIEYNKILPNQKMIGSEKFLFDSIDNILSDSIIMNNNYPIGKIIDEHSTYTIIPTPVLLRTVFINISNSTITHWIIPSNDYKNFISYHTRSNLHKDIKNTSINIQQLLNNNISYYTVTQKSNEILIIPFKSIHWYEVKESAFIMTYNLLFIEDLIEVFEEYNHIKELKIKYPIPFLSIILSFINKQLFTLSIEITKYLNIQLNQIHEKEKMLLKEILNAIAIKELRIIQERIIVNENNYYCEECSGELFNYNIIYSLSQEIYFRCCLACFNSKIKLNFIFYSIKLCNHYYEKEIELLFQRIHFKYVNYYNILSFSFQGNPELYSKFKTYRIPQDAFIYRLTQNQSHDLSIELSSNYIQFNNDEIIDVDLISKNLITLGEPEEFNNKLRQIFPLNFHGKKIAKQYYVDYETLLYQNNIMMFSPNPYIEYSQIRTETEDTKFSKKDYNQLIESIQHQNLSIEEKQKELFQLKKNSLKNRYQFPGKHIFNFIQSMNQNNYEEHAYRAMFNMSYADYIIKQEQSHKCK